MSNLFWLWKNWGYENQERENIPDLLDFLDPNAIVCDVKVIEYVGGIVLSEDLVDIQQAF